MRSTPRLLRVSLAALLLTGALAACAPVSTLNVLSPRSTYVLTEGVAYGTSPRQQLDVYTPVLPAPNGGWPVAVFFYGGTWNDGNRADYRFVGEALASRGVLTMVADYRLYPEVKYPAFLEDSAHAVAYALANAKSLGGNARRVYIVGHSAGSYNAAMLALDPRWLKAAGTSPDALAGWVGLAGPYDFYPIENPNAQPVFSHPEYPPHSQPGEFVSSRAPRTFLGAARRDSLVDPQRNTVALGEKLKAAGVPVQVKLYKHVGHVTMAASMAAPLRWLAPVLDDVANFIETGRPARRQLSVAEPAPGTSQAATAPESAPSPG
jgi:acetyl esterase/lipase